MRLSAYSPGVAEGLFLRLNGRRLTASQGAAARKVPAVAASERDINALAEWIRENSTAEPGVTP